MTEIHAAIPNSLAVEVKEAQMRGEEKEATPEPSIPKPQVKGKGKERLKVTPTAAKIHRLAPENEENTRRRGETQEPESDPESDWIPGPDKTPKAPATQRDNIFGIKGLQDTMQLDTPPKSIFTVESTSAIIEDKETLDDSDPFIAVTSKRATGASSSFDLRLPPPVALSSSSISHPTLTDTPELLKYSHQNPFSAIQPNNQTQPLIMEFSYSWEESELLHDTNVIKDGVTKLDVKKRMASKDFEKKRKWELKRFKKAGCDLGRYNRGDWGPRTGVGRL